MCSERDFRCALREGPVDRDRVCYCSVPEAVQVVVRKVQILSFDESMRIGSAADNSVPAHAPFRSEGKAA